MKLHELLTEECIKAPLEATSKRGVIDELVDVLADHGRIADADSHKSAVWAREQARTTGIGLGLAIPHGKCEGVADPVMALGRPPEPMDFESIDGQPVRLIVLLASPPDRTSEHIQALARISRLMNFEDFREAIYGAETAGEIHRLLREQDSRG